MRTGVVKTLLFASLVIASLMFTHLGDAGINPEDLAAIWLFDEASGDVAGDSSGNENNGEIKGAEWTKGKFGSALEFDGKDDYVEVAHKDVLNITDKLTLVAWVKPGGNNAANYVAILQRQHSNAANDTYLLGFNSSYKLHFGTMNGNIQSTQTTWDDGQWYHVAGTYTADGFEGHLYINGIEEKLSVDNADKMAGGVRELYLGRWLATYFNGTIDEVGIFNAVLTEDDIKNIMNLGLAVATGLKAAVSSKEKLAITWGKIKRP